MASTEALIRAAQDGDGARLAELLERHTTYVERRVRRRMGAALRREHEVEDLCQETYGEIVASLPRFTWRDEPGFVAWVHTIADRVCARAVRKLKERRSLQLEPEPVGHEVTASRAARREERFARLRESIDALPEPYREAVRLVRIEGLRIAEAAERMGKTDVALRQLISRGLRKMRETFGDTVSFGLPDRPLELGDVDPVESRGDD